MDEQPLEIKIQMAADKATMAFKQLNTSILKSGAAIETVTAKVNEFNDVIGYTKVTKSLDGTRVVTQKLNSDMKVLSSSVKENVKDGTSLGSILKSAFDINRLYLYWNLTKKIRTAISGFFQASVDYIETQNKFNVSMGSAQPEAVKYVNKTTEAVGIATTELMNYMATYKNILSGLGNFTDVQAEKMSESLTNMALDYSSLFNVTTEQANSKFQAALTGSIRPIRSDSGFDVSDTTIGAKAQELGVEASVSQLNQMEKRILRIIVLMDQMKNTGAFGDLARTIEQPANQAKILKEQIQELGVWIGNVFMGTIGAILPYINAFVMVLKELIKLFAIFVGYQSDENGIGDAFEVANDSVGGIGSGLGDANKKAKELKKTLMGFDVLNVITTPKEKEPSGGGGGIGSIDPKILGALEDYDSLLSNVKMKATDIRDRIMEWLGYTKIIDPLTGEISWYLNEGYQNIEKIKHGIEVVGTLLAGLYIFKNWSKIKNGITTLVTAFSTKGALFTGISKIGTAIFGIFGVTGSSALVTFSAGLTAIVGAVYLVSAGIKAWKWATDEAIGSTDKLAGTSEDTIQRLVPVQNAFDELVKTVNDVSYDGLALTEDEKQKIISSIDTLTAQLKAALQDYTDESIKQLNYLYFETGLITEDEYNKRLKQLQDSHNKELQEIDKQSEKLKTETQNIYDENGNIRMNAYAQWLMDLENFENRSLEVLTVSEDDKKKIREGADKATLEEKKKYYSELFTGYVEDRDNAIKNAQEKYDKTVEYAKNTYGESSAEYQALQEKAKQIYDQEVLDAQTKYDNLYRELELSQTEIASYIDKDTGGVKSNWQKMWDDMKNAASNAMRTVLNDWLGLSFPDKYANFSIKGGGGSGGGNIGTRAEGGPVNVGELFIAREAGPELVGKIGNTNAVMNNNQIVQSVSQGVAAAVSSVLGNGLGTGDVRLIVDGRELSTVVESRMTRKANIFGTA